MEDCVGIAKFTSMLGLLKGYWQVPHPMGIWNFWFCYNRQFPPVYGHGFRLRNAPCTFQQHEPFLTISNTIVLLTLMWRYTRTLGNSTCNCWSLHSHACLMLPWYWIWINVTMAKGFSLTLVKLLGRVWWNFWMQKSKLFAQFLRQRQDKTSAIFNVWLVIIVVYVWAFLMLFYPRLTSVTTHDIPQICFGCFVCVKSVQVRPFQTPVQAFLPCLRCCSITFVCYFHPKNDVINRRQYLTEKKAGSHSFILQMLTCLHLWLCLWVRSIFLLWYFWFLICACPDTKLELSFDFFLLPRFVNSHTALFL